MQILEISPGRGGEGRKEKRIGVKTENDARKEKGFDIVREQVSERVSKVFDQNHTELYFHVILHFKLDKSSHLGRQSVQALKINVSSLFSE